LLTSLGKGAIIPLGLYLLLRLSDLSIQGVLPGAIDGSWQSFLFMAEILLGGILPIVLLSIKKIRQTREGLLTSAILAILGIMSQRMSLSMFTMFREAGTTYSPSLGETVIAFAIPAAAILLYLFFTENLQVFEKQAQSSEGEALAPVPVSSGVFTGQETWGRAVVARRSGFAIFVIALALPALSLQSNTPPSPVTAAAGWETLHIDGNASGYMVDFPHLEHQERLADGNAGQDNCQTCHHLDVPGDEATACWECHTDYHQPISIYDHSVHQGALGGNGSCQECHTREHVKLTAEICQDCHESMTPDEGQTTFSMLAPSYKDALHGRCLDCHEEQTLKQDKPELVLCSTCHTYYQNESDQTYASLAGK
jgi:hypothetical protein